MTESNDLIKSKVAGINFKYTVVYYLILERTKNMETKQEREIQLQ